MIKVILKYIGIVTAFAAGIGLVIKVYSYLENLPERAEQYNKETQAVVKAYADTTFNLINRIESGIYEQKYRLDDIAIASQAAQRSDMRDLAAAIHHVLLHGNQLQGRGNQVADFGQFQTGFGLQAHDLQATQGIFW